MARGKVGQQAENQMEGVDNNPTDNPAAKFKKKRATKACMACRGDKTACDVMETGTICTNCRRRRIVCTVTATKSRSRSRKKRLLSIEQARLSDGFVPTNLTTLPNRRPLGSDTSVEEQNHGYTNDRPRNSISDLINSVSFYGDRSATSLEIATPDSSSPWDSVPLPGYFKKPSSKITRDEIEYLWIKDALSIPDIALRTELVQSYIEHVHSSMPLIDLDSFLQIIEEDGKNEASMSLIVFQAVMFAGTAFADMSCLERAGYESRREARRAFHRKVKLLYEFDFEVDTLPLVQSLLLMTFLSESSSNGKDEWHWLGLALSHALTIGLHRNPQTSGNFSFEDQRLRKRIWWSCMLRDRLLALGMRRPIRIKDKDYDVPMLKSEDFDFHTYSGNQEYFPRRYRVRDSSLQLQLAMIFISKARLCLFIGQILTTQYDALVRDQGMNIDRGGKIGSRVILCPKPSSHSCDTRLYEVQLADWLSHLPSHCRYVLPNARDLSDDEKCLLVERAVLHMTYFSTSCLLHRPHVVPSTDKSLFPHSKYLQAFSMGKIREASRATTKMALDLHNLNLTRYLPATAVTALTPAMTCHLTDIKESKNETCEEALQGFSQCMDVLQELRDIHGPADDVFEFLNTVVTLADICVTPGSLSSDRGDMSTACTGSDSSSDYGLLNSGDQDYAYSDDGVVVSLLPNVSPYENIASPIGQTSHPHFPIDAVAEFIGDDTAQYGNNFDFRMNWDGYVEDLKFDGGISFLECTP